MKLSRTWEELRKSGRQQERLLEDKLPQLGSGLTGDTQQDLIREIEESLSVLSETIDQMNEYATESSSTSQTAVVQRYRELYFDYNTQFKRTTTSIQQQRDRNRLFGDRSERVEDGETDVLLRERNAIDSSRTLTEHIIGQAMATKNQLDTQRNRYMHSRNRVTGLSNTFTGINSLISDIKRKKIRNNTIIALVVAGLICFSLWWTILS